MRGCMKVSCCWQPRAVHISFSRMSHVFIDIETIHKIPANVHYKQKPTTLCWRYNERHGVWNHQPPDCKLSRLFRRASKKTSKLRVTGLCEGNTPVTGGFPSQRTTNVSIRWRHHENEQCGRRCNLTQWTITGQTFDRLNPGSASEQSLVNQSGS